MSKIVFYLKKFWYVIAGVGALSIAYVFGRSSKKQEATIEIENFKQTGYGSDDEKKHETIDNPLSDNDIDDNISRLE